MRGEHGTSGLRIGVPDARLETKQVQRASRVLCGVQLERQATEHTELHRCGRISWPARLATQIIAPHNCFLKSGLGARPFAEVVLQLVELRNQAIGISQGLEIPTSLHEEHSRSVCSRYQLHRCRGHIVEDLLECARGGHRACKLGHAHGEVVPEVRVRRVHVIRFCTMQRASESTARKPIDENQTTAGAGKPVYGGASRATTIDVDSGS
jgi:hypothetical protein